MTHDQDLLAHVTLACDLLRRGGEWLGATRRWIQSRCLNGAQVTWGSNDELRPTMTARDIEEVAAHAAAAAYNDKRTQKPPRHISATPITDPFSGKTYEVEASVAKHSAMLDVRDANGDLVVTLCVIASHETVHWDAMKGNSDAIHHRLIDAEFVSP
jgi:hypothetical protein